MWEAPIAALAIAEDSDARLAAVVERVRDLECLMDGAKTLPCAEVDEAIVHPLGD